MVEVIDGLLAALAGLPLWALAGAVAVVMALEASLLTGVVVPGDLVVLFVASTATTPTRWVVLWAAVAAGSVAGETVGYGIGHLFGQRVQASRIGRWLGPQRWARAAGFLQRRGARAVFAGRFLAAVHAVLPIVAGTVRMGYRRFLTAAVVGALPPWRAGISDPGYWGAGLLSATSATSVTTIRRTRRRGLGPLARPVTNR
jgi:membrane-associated protein